MKRLLASVAFALLLLSPAVAQERYASIKLEDGRSLEGRVLVLNLDKLEIEVDNKILTIPAAQIRSCRFKQGVDPASVGAGDETEAAAAKPAGADPAAAVPTVAVPQGPAGSAKPATKADAVGDATARDQAAVPAGQDADSRITWTGPIADPVVPGSAETVPVDQRNGTHWQRRIGALDRAYPWLAPAAPRQWISLGLLLLIASGLVVHMSVWVVGGEAVQLSRSVGLGIWYMVTGWAQVAMVPITDLNIVLMILINTTLSLFALCSLFGLARLNAVVALTVQLGFGVLVFGILELVTALLGTVGVTP